MNKYKVKKNISLGPNMRHNVTLALNNIDSCFNILDCIIKMHCIAYLHYTKLVAKHPGASKSTWVGRVEIDNQFF